MTRIVKVGGSLWEYDRLVSALHEWLASQPPDLNVLVVGGGPLADVIRDVDARLALGEVASDRLCVRLLGVTARMLAWLLPEAELIDTYERLRHVVSDYQQQRDPNTPPVIFSPEDFLHRDEPFLAGQPLPHNWSVTTDSIAARLAQVLTADDLVLLKSADPPLHRSRQSAAADGFVDAHFPIASQALPLVRCVNLRDARFVEVSLS